MSDEIKCPDCGAAALWAQDPTVYLCGSTANQKSLSCPLIADLRRQRDEARRRRDVWRARYDEVNKLRRGLDQRISALEDSTSGD